MNTSDTPTGTVEEAAARLSLLDSVADTEERETDQADAVADAEDVSEEETDEALEASDAETADDDEGSEDEADATDEDDDEGDEEEEDQLYTVKINGKEEKITLTEALKGYQRQADYTRKMQDLADRRRETDGERDALKAEREQYSQLLPALQKQIEGALENEPDWNALYQQDPIEWARQRELWRDMKEQNELVKAEQQRMSELQRQEQQQALQAYVKSEQEKLLKALPDWKDPKVARAEIERIRDYGLSLGFSPEELENTFDHRAVLALHKAMKYDAMVQRKPQRAQRQGPKVARPGASGSTPTTPKKQARQAMKRLKETGSVQAAANALLNLY